MQSKDTYFFMACICNSLANLHFFGILNFLNFQQNADDQQIWTLLHLNSQKARVGSSSGNFKRWSSNNLKSHLSTSSSTLTTDSGTTVHQIIKFRNPLFFEFQLSTPFPPQGWSEQLRLIIRLSCSSGKCLITIVLWDKLHRWFKTGTTGWETELPYDYS